MSLRATQSKLIAVVALGFVVFYNYPLFSHTLQIFPCKKFLDYVRIGSLGIVLWGSIIFLLTLVSSRYTTKPIIILLLMISSFTTYFMNTYDVVIDDSMIRNALQTDIHESLDLLNQKLSLYILFLGVIPSYLVYKTRILYHNPLKELRAKIKMIFFSF